MSSINKHEAWMNITWQGQNGDLADPVSFTASDHQLKHWAAEAIRGRSVPGIHTRDHVSLNDFIVDRFPANRTNPYNRIMIRPKTPFG